VATEKYSTSDQLHRVSQSVSLRNSGYVIIFHASLLHSYICAQRELEFHSSQDIPQSAFIPLCKLGFNMDCYGQ
jgi:hypothetical protein